MLTTKDIIQAHEVTIKTLVASGNCFSVRTDNGELRVVNFYYETLMELISENKLSFPIAVIKLTSTICVIVDPRIDKSLYREGFCEACTPIEYLPIPQRVKHLLDIQNGKREEKATGNGVIISLRVN